MVAVAHGSPLTYDDLQRLPDDGYRHELLDGMLLMTPSPSVPHQVCVLTLAFLLRQHRRPGEIVLVAPFDYVISQSTVLEPDVVVARTADHTHANLPSTPLLVVEVLSPSTHRVDRTAKRSAYEEAGVPAYWLVDPDVPAVTVLELVDARYEQVAVVAGEESYTASTPFPVEITPARLLDDLS